MVRLAQQVQKTIALQVRQELQVGWGSLKGFPWRPWRSWSETCWGVALWRWWRWWIATTSTCPASGSSTPAWRAAPSWCCPATTATWWLGPTRPRRWASAQVAVGAVVHHVDIFVTCEPGIVNQFLSLLLRKAGDVVAQKVEGVAQWLPPLLIPARRAPSYSRNRSSSARFRERNSTRYSRQFPPHALLDVSPETRHSS